MARCVHQIEDVALVVEAHGLGQLWPAEAGFDLTRPDEEQQTVLAPDIAFVRAHVAG